METLPSHMKAIACDGTASNGGMAALADIILPLPQGGNHDLLVEVKAVSVNPCDIKLRQNIAPADQHRVLGHDVAAIVRWVGQCVDGFSVGDAVWYAGNIARQGANAQFHLVDARLAATKPYNLSFAEAAAMPLTTLTAWEALFEHMRIDRAGAAGSVLLIVGATGGVGSIAIQLAARLSGVVVVATAGTEQGAAWCRTMGAHHVLSHREDLPTQLLAHGVANPDYILALAGVDQHWPSLVDMIRPRGALVMVDDPRSVNLMEMKPKSITLHLEGVFARPRFGTIDMAEHGRILRRVSGLVEQGVLRPTLTRHRGIIEAAGLQAAHEDMIAGGQPGKIALEGF